MYNAHMDYEQFQTFQRQQWENFQSFQKQQWDQFNQFSRNQREFPAHPQAPVRSFPQAYLPHYVQQAPQYSHPQQTSYNFSDEDQHFSPILNRFREPQQFEEQHPLRWLYNLFENHTNPQERRRPRVVIPRGYRAPEQEEPTVEEAEDPEIEENAKAESNDNEEATNRWIEFLKYLHNKQQEANKRKQAAENSSKKTETPQQTSQQQKKIEESSQTGSSPFDFLGDIFQGFKKQGQSQEQPIPQPVKKEAAKGQPVKQEAGKAQAAKQEAPKPQPAKRDSQIPVRPVEKPLTTQERLDKVAAEFEAIKANLWNGKPKATESKLMTLLTMIDDIHCEDEKQKAFRHKLAGDINRTIESLLESESAAKSDSAPKQEEVKSEGAAEEVKAEASEEEAAAPSSEPVSIPISSSDADSSRSTSSVFISEPDAESHINIPVTSSEAAPAKEEAPSPSATLDRIAEEYGSLSSLIESKSFPDRKSIKAAENKLNKLLFTLDEFQCPADLRPRKKELVKNINNAIELLFNLEEPSPAPSPAVQPAQTSEEPATQPESQPEPAESVPEPVQADQSTAAELAPEPVSEATSESVEVPASEPAAEPEPAVQPESSGEPAASTSNAEAVSSDLPDIEDQPNKEGPFEFSPQPVVESTPATEASTNEQAVEISSTTAPVEEASTTDTVTSQPVSDPVSVQVDDVLIESVPVGAD